MKKLKVLAVVMVFSLNAFAQLNMESGSYVFHKAVREHATKQKIYNKAVQWASEKYKDNAGRVKYRNIESGQIVIEGKFEHVMHGVPGLISYILTIEARNGVYRESYRSFQYRGKGGKVFPLENKRLSGKSKIIEDTNIELAEISKDLIDYISSDILAKK